MEGKIKTRIFIVLLLVISSNLIKAQTRTNLYLGDAIELQSKVLKQSRTIFIYKPFNYNSVNDSYPVIYVFDALGNFLPTVGIVNSLVISGIMPESIIVGIVNKDRTWDFTPVEEEGRVGDSGGGNNFVKFIKDELKPFIDSTYGTKPYNTIIGHSLCGMFAMYLLVKEPSIFNSYIAISPHLQYADEYVLNLTEKKFEKQPPQNKTIFFTVGNEPNYLPSLERFSDQLSGYDDFIDWEYREYKDENHVSVVHKSIYDGLKFIYNDWQIPASVLTTNLTEIQNYYKELSVKFCYDVYPPERNLNLAGYQLLNKNNFTEAIKIFEYAVAAYPNSTNTYDSLGEAFERSGNLTDAIFNYKKAIELGKNSDEINIKIYYEHMNRAINKQKNQ